MHISCTGWINIKSLQIRLIIILKQYKIKYIFILMGGGRGLYFIKTIGGGYDFLTKTLGERNDKKSPLPPGSRVCTILNNWYITLLHAILGICNNLLAFILLSAKTRQSQYSKQAFKLKLLMAYIQPDWTGLVYFWHLELCDHHLYKSHGQRPQNSGLSGVLNYYVDNKINASKF